MYTAVRIRCFFDLETNVTDSDQLHHKKPIHWTFSFPGLRFALPIFIVLLGLTLVQIGSSYPQYTNPAAVEKLRMMPPEAFDDMAFKFQDELAKYEKPHRPLINAGSGCISLGLSLGAFLAIFGIRSLSDLGAIKTPGSRFAFMGLVDTTCVCAVLAESYHLDCALRRGDFPYWAEAIIIPIFQMTLAVVILLLLLNFIFGVFSGRTIFPVGLFDYPVTKSVGNITCTIVLVILVIASMYDIYDSIATGAFLMVPVALTIMYLVVSARSALLAFSSPRSNAAP
jgi:hypothetical protein